MGKFPFLNILILIILGLLFHFTPELPSLPTGAQDHIAFATYLEIARNVLPPKSDRRLQTKGFFVII